MTQLSEIFWSTFVTTMSGVVLAMIAVAYKSKCRNISCCFGLLQIERDTEGEEKIDELDVEHQHTEN
jgi:hypothetical protein